MKPKPLTPARADALLGDRKSSSGQPRIIWTLGGIAKRIGCGTDFVRDTLARQPGSPIRQVGGRWFVFEDDLITFLRGS